ncbi:unnamed protein product [Aphis gossypii]|uniref:Uncharacterized protein n=1 Tax=Aphis gossypii TaxID=80765 RepID=A0A9P0NPB2_APHGO|nr:unnamed protein product [Aphis gossypii]
MCMYRCVPQLQPCRRTLIRRSCATGQSWNHYQCFLFYSVMFKTFKLFRFVMLSVSQSFQFFHCSVFSVVTLKDRSFEYLRVFHPLHVEVNYFTFCRCPVSIVFRSTCSVCSRPKPRCCDFVNSSSGNYRSQHFLLPSLTCLSPV